MKYDSQGLIPAIIQDHSTRQVLMLGYMNEEALNLTLSSGKVTFFSRSKQRLWTKGESSGNYLVLKSWQLDCDEDTILIKAEPHGPTCHTGSDTCWGDTNEALSTNFLEELEQIIDDRYEDRAEGSYTASLFEKGVAKIAQKVGEEAVEVVIESLRNEDEKFLGESADLIFHFLVLLRERGYQLKDVVEVLEERHK